MGIRHGLFAFCTAAVLMTASVHAAITVPLSAQDVADAIRWARTGRPEPYIIYINPQRMHPVGFVYTPYVRVAMAARQALSAGRPVTPSIVSATASDGLVYVAVDWYSIQGSPFNLCNTVAPGESCLRDQAIVGLAGGTVGGTPHGLVPRDPAVWITRDLSVLSRFGGTIPAEHTAHIAAVAAFPPKMFEPGKVIGACVWRDEDAPQPGCEPRAGIVIALDFATWR